MSLYGILGVLLVGRLHRSAQGAITGELERHEWGGPARARVKNGILEGVSCSSAKACTAVGPYVKKKSGAELTLAERYS